jgi:hypothetical protein
VLPGAAALVESKAVTAAVGPLIGPFIEPTSKQQ